MDSMECGLLANLLADNVKFRIFWSTLGLVGALLVGAVIVSVVERWRKRAGSEGLSAGDQLTHFRELRDKGTISQEEYERIRTQLSEGLRKEMNLPSPSAPSPTEYEKHLPQVAEECKETHVTTTPASTPIVPPSQNGMTLRDSPPPESPASPQ